MRIYVFTLGKDYVINKIIKNGDESWLNGSRSGQS